MHYISYSIFPLYDYGDDDDYGRCNQLNWRESEETGVWAVSLAGGRKTQSIEWTVECEQFCVNCRMWTVYFCKLYTCRWNLPPVWHNPLFTGYQKKRVSSSSQLDRGGTRDIQDCVNRVMSTRFYCKFCKGTEYYWKKTDVYAVGQTEKVIGVFVAFITCCPHSV